MQNKRIRFELKTLTFVFAVVIEKCRHLANFIFCVQDVAKLHDHDVILI